MTQQSTAMPMTVHEHWRELARQLRADIVRVCEEAGSGHPTSSLSAADLMAVLYAEHLRCRFSDPNDPCNDRVVFSKGHATPLLYALLHASGAVTEDELLSYRKRGSLMEGHPTPALPWADVATGSLGQGLPFAVGIALSGRHLERLPYHVWVLCGDSELAEGSMWEAFEHAAHDGLDNLTAIIDVNRLGQRGATRHGWDLDAYARRIEAFGWKVLTIDGHDVAAIDEAYRTAQATKGRPTAVLARTVKGKGVKSVEDLDGFHGKPIPNAEEALKELGGVTRYCIDVRPPDLSIDLSPPAIGVPELPAYDLGSEVATRNAYGEALAALMNAREDVVALDAEVSNSTMSAHAHKAHPERFVEGYIAEQLMVAIAVGLQTRGWKPFASTFAAFLTRAYDFVRMAAVSRADCCFVGSHAGVAIGPDGPSQMGLEDLAAFRAVHGSTVLYPCDANQTAQLLPLLASSRGVSYLRTSRSAMSVLYSPHERFTLGGSRVLRRNGVNDDVALIGAGITVHEALAAADALAAEGITARVIDCYSVKPIDASTVCAAARDCDGRLVVAEDHWPEGGLGDAVLDALAETGTPTEVRKLAVRNLPGSATPEEQLADAGIDSHAIADAARRLVGTHAVSTR